MNNDDVIDTVNDLIDCVMDGESGFRASAESILNPQTKQLLLQRADECSRAAAELQPIAVNLGGEPRKGGSTGGAVRRGWVAVKATLSAHSDRAILDEAQRADDRAIRRYQAAMNKELPAAVRVVIEGQYLGLQRHHTQIKALRDAERMAPH
jgi:uncharacterized protein (TIGR02284 family)